jgi:hypothetical protein
MSTPFLQLLAEVETAFSPLIRTDEQRGYFKLWLAAALAGVYMSGIEARQIREGVERGDAAVLVLFVPRSQLLHADCKVLLNPIWRRASEMIFAGSSNAPNSTGIASGIAHFHLLLVVTVDGRSVAEAQFRLPAAPEDLFGDRWDEMRRSLHPGIVRSMDVPDGTPLSPHFGLTTRCHGCGKDDAKLRRCARCSMGWYCSKECQRADFPLHRTVCRRF